MLQRKKQHFMVLCAFSLSLLSACVQADTGGDYYISPAGSDSNAGSKEQPFRTIEKARDIIREKTGDWTEDITVWLGEGTYSLSGTLEFTAMDSGKDGYHVIYKALPGEEPVISGGKQITGWTEYKNGIYRAVCPPGVNGFRQLYVLGKRATRARMPNRGQYHRLYQWRVSDQTVRVRGKDMDEDWQNLANGKVEIIIQQYWAGSTMRIESVSQNGAYRDIVPNDTERDIVFGREWPQKSPEQAYHFENSLDFVDQGGEWYLDDNVTPHVLYYLPREGEDLLQAEVTAPVVETLVRIGGADLATKVHHLAFEGITFEHANWTRPDRQGNIGLQSQQYSIGDNQCDRPEAGVFVQNAHHVRFTRNTFRNLGSAGLDVYTGTNSIKIEGNVFYDIAGNGMQVGKFTEAGTVIAVPYNPSDSRKYCENILIANNYIFKVAQDYYSGNGIAAGYIRNSSIVHNEIRDLPYTGISVGWGWTENPCALGNNKIEYNRIYDVVQLLCDGAGIYTLGYAPNSFIRYNYVRGIVKSSWASTSYSTTYPLACIYLDQGSKGYTITQNVLRDAHQDNYIHNGMNTQGKNIQENNYRQESTVEEGSGIEPAFQDIRDIEGVVLSANHLIPSKATFCKVYPTLTTGTLYITLRFAVPFPMEVSIYSLSGGDRLKQIMCAPAAGDLPLKIDVSDLASGTYICHIRAPGRTASEKFIVL